MNNIEETKFGLFFFYNCDKKNIFILNINNTIQKQNYHGTLNENKENIFTKKNYVSWKKNVIKKVENNNNLTETKFFRIVFNSIQPNIYYFEKNGAINCIDRVIKNYNFFDFNKYLWKKIYDYNKNHNENVINYMNEYIKKEYEKDIQETNKIFVNEFNKKIIDNNFNYDYYDFYNLFNDIEEINKEYKLPSYNKYECIDRYKKQSETVYNNLVYEKNKDKYILLDRKIIEGCEVADLYDIQNKLLFHNKKRGDLRIVSLQTIIGALIMKNRDKHKQYIYYLKEKGINQTIDNKFSYVIGIIGKNRKIAIKDKLTLGIIQYILKQHNIKLYIDFIDII